MLIKHMYHDPSGCLIAALSGTFDRQSRLRIYSEIASQAVQFDSKRLIVDKTEMADCDHLEIDEASWANTQIADHLTRAGVREVLFLVDDTELVTSLLAADLRKAGLTVTFADRLADSSAAA